MASKGFTHVDHLIISVYGKQMEFTELQLLNEILGTKTASHQSHLPYPKFEL